MSAPNVPIVLMAVLWVILLSVVAPSLGCEGTELVSVKGRHFTLTSIEWAQDDSWIQLEISLSIVVQLYVYTEPAPPLNWCSVASVIEVCKVNYIM